MYDRQDRQTGIVQTNNMQILLLLLVQIYPIHVQFNFFQT